LENKILSNINLASIEKEIRVMEKHSYHEDEVYKINNQSSLFELIYKEFMRFIHPGEYKFPKK